MKKIFLILTFIAIGSCTNKKKAIPLFILPSLGEVTTEVASIEDAVISTTTNAAEANVPGSITLSAVTLPEQTAPSEASPEEQAGDSPIVVVEDGEESIDVEIIVDENEIIEIDDDVKVCYFKPANNGSVKFKASKTAKFSKHPYWKQGAYKNCKKKKKEKK